MTAPLPLRAALVRGALVTVANWPITLIDFAIESLYKLTLVVPIAGGALMVAVLAGGSVRPIFAEGVRLAAGVILSALTSAPAALVSFVVALLIVAVGGALLMFLLKAGTLAILVAGERRAGQIEQEELAYASFVRAFAYNLDDLVAGTRRFGRRMVSLGLWLSGAYTLVGAAYLVALGGAFRLASDPRLAAAWPLIVGLATAIGIVALATVNVAFDLMRIIVVCDDCALGRAASRLLEFLVQDARQVVGIFAVVTVLLALAAAASLLVVAGLTLVAWVPVIGLIVVPLQAAAWLIRGLLFQSMGLAALCAYETQYRRFSQVTDEQAASVPATLAVE